MRRHHKEKSRLSAAVAAFLALTAGAGAAQLTNKDTESYTVIVTEDGVKNELAIAGGETLTFCNSGCFLTLPSGNKAALAGAEGVEIINGEAVVK